LADFDHDGRVDLVVTQNAAATRLFRNQLEANGLRVRLDGEGAGVRLRLIYADGTRGPVRVVQSGSGYRSVNATTQVLGAAREAVAVEVAWPGTAKTNVPLKSGQAEVVLSHP